MRLKPVSLLFLQSLTIAVTVTFSSGQQFYSYLDETGTEVFTNIPPALEEIPEGTFTTTRYGTGNSPLPTETVQPDSGRFDSIINKYASHYQLDPSLIHSIIATESGFNPNAVSSKGARGLMQLMPETARRLGVENSFDPEQNIRAGVRHFRSLMDMFNHDLDLSLAAYNAGENLVRRLGRVPRYEETMNYVQSVTRRYREKRNTREDPAPSPTYRYVDEKGVLHLTNIPPVQ
jgi:soluble lytic murein transglycosylase-like protein